MRSRKLYLFAMLGISLQVAQLTPAQTAEKRTLTLDGAERIIAAHH
jgi:hypothetical protein